MKKRIWQTAAAALAVLFFCIGTAAFAAEQTEEGKPPDQEEKPAAFLSGRVLHTKQWDENREEANRRYAAEGENQYFRRDDTFWTGEKFVLQAEAGGEDLPDFVSVYIQGTGYETKMYRQGDLYQGTLFEEDMLYRWGQRDPETLTFIFEADIDGSRITDSIAITVDDRQPYWLLHRKR